jgi:hypothetical protein
MVYDAGGDILWSTAASGTAGNTFTFSERMRITSGGNVGIGTSSPVAADSSSVTLQLRNNVIIQNVVGTQGLFSNNAYYDNTWKRVTTLGAAAVRMNADTGEYGISFHVAASGSAGSTIADWDTTGIKMRINESGIVVIGKTVTDGAVTAGCEFRPQGFGYFTRDGGESLIINRKSNNGIQIQFRRDNSDVGNISSTTSVTSFNVTSDYRLKEDFKEVNGLEKLSKIKVYDYLWKSDKTRMDGVIAHELQEILPYAVTGDKDAINEDGKPIMQSVDYSKIVAILIKSVQEQQSQIEELKELIKNK